MNTKISKTYIKYYRARKEHMEALLKSIKTVESKQLSFEFACLDKFICQFMNFWFNRYLCLHFSRVLEKDYTKQNKNVLCETCQAYKKVPFRFLDLN